jgi:hypothetical protein
LLVGDHFLLAIVLFRHASFVVLVSPLHPSVHVRLVCTSVILFTKAFFSHLISKDVVKLLVLGPCLVLLADVLKASLIILFDTLLDVFFFLLKLELFAIVSNDFSHAIHDSLNAATALCHLVLTRLLFLELHAHVLFDLLSLGFLDSVELCHALLLLDHVVLNHFHCSLALSNFFVVFPFFLFIKVCSEFGNTLSFFVLTSRCIFHLLALRFLEHLVTQFFLLLHFLLKVLLLFAFNFHLFLSSIKQFFIEIHSFFLIFFTKFLSQFDLLVKYISDLCLSLCMHGLLLFDLLFVELLAELLDLSPLVVTDVRRHVFNFDSPHSVWQFANLLATKLG